MKGSRGERVLGGRVLGLWGILKKGESSTPPIDLGEGGGRTRMRNKRWQVQDALGTFPIFVQDACGVVPDACGLERNMCFRGRFFEGEHAKNPKF